MCDSFFLWEGLVQRKKEKPTEVGMGWKFPILCGEWVSEVSQTCPTLCDPMDCSLPSSSIHGIFQAKVLEWRCHFLLQAIFPTKGSNLGRLHCRKMLHPLSHYVVGLKYMTKSRDVLSWNPQQKISKEFTRIPLSSFYKWRNEGTGKFIDWVITIKLVNTRIDLLLLLSWLVVINVKVADILNLHAILPCLTILGAQSCLTVCESVDCSPPGSSVHGIFQARILERVAISYTTEIFLTQGSNLRLLSHLHWQVDSLSLNQLGTSCLPTLHDALSLCRQEFWPRHSVPRERF